MRPAAQRGSSPPYELRIPFPFLDYWPDFPPPPPPPRYKYFARIFSALCRRSDTLPFGARVYWMLIGACNPIVCCARSMTSSGGWGDVIRGAVLRLRRVRAVRGRQPGQLDRALFARDVPGQRKGKVGVAMANIHIIDQAISILFQDISSHPGWRIERD